MTSNEGFTPTPDPDSEVKTTDEMIEEMIDYIVNHKNNLNGNILMEALGQLSSSGEEQGSIPVPFNPDPGSGNAT